jgi:uncharacterized protein (TIGR02001 family)
MKTLVLSVAVSALMSATAAFAADMQLKAPPPAPSPWDIAFGGALMTDYNFRGISQSNRGPSTTFYVESRYNVNSSLQLYAGSQYWAVTLPTNPTCECDFYGGIRPTFGPVTFDLGFIYYYYPKEQQHAAVVGAPFPPFPNGNMTLNDTDYYEGYGKFSYDVIKDKFNVGGNFYYSPSWLNTGAYGAYGSLTAKYTLPSVKLRLGLIDEVGIAVSGELGHYWLGTTRVVPVVLPVAIDLPDYTTWNVGVTFSFAKVFSFDVRYYDTNLSRSNCNVLTGDPNASGAPLGSNWCSATVIGALKADLTYLSNLK